jgi:hypothetical protein
MSRSSTPLLRDADAEGAQNVLLQLHVFPREASKTIPKDLGGLRD